MKKKKSDLKYDEELCLFYFEIEDFECARRISGELLEAEDKNYTALLVLGMIEEELEHFPEAINYYKKLLQAHPDDAECLKRKALAELYCYDGLQALEDINKSIVNEAGDPEAYVIRGLIQSHGYDKKKEAIIDYNQALKIDPDNICAIYNRGLTFLKIGNKQYAYDDLSKAASRGYMEAEMMISKYFPEKESQSL